MSLELVGARRIARSTMWNLAGQALPIVAALLAVPLLIRALGLERFGLLTLVWMLIGYFSLFDLGIGWALTRTLSEKLATGRDEEVPRLVWTAQALLLALGGVGALSVALATPWLVHGGLSIPPELRGEASGAFYILALTLPLVTGTAALAGVLSAHQRFGALNAVRSPMGAFSFAGPLLILPFTTNLAAVAAILAAGRLVGWVAHLAICLRVVPALRREFAFDGAVARPLARFGGWMTVSAVVGPVMVYMDRFIVGGMLSLSMVAYYATPYDLVSRLWVLSTPIVGVLFPAFAGIRATDPLRSARLYGWGLRAVFVALFPGALIFATFAHEILTIWLGSAFAASSGRILQLLAIGVFINGLAQVSLAFVQSTGHPNWSARLHLLELPFYLMAVWLLIRGRGIEGAALAWVGRASVDALVLFAMADRLAGPRPDRALTILMLATAIGALVGGCLLPGLMARAIYLITLGSIFMGVAWTQVVRPARAVLER